METLVYISVRSLCFCGSKKTQNQHLVNRAALSSCLIAQRNIHHAVVHHVGQSGHVRTLLPSVGCSCAGESSAKLSRQRATLPELSSAIEEGFHLGSRRAKASTNSEDKSLATNLWDRMGVVKILHKVQAPWFCTQSGKIMRGGFIGRHGFKSPQDFKKCAKGW